MDEERHSEQRPLDYATPPRRGEPNWRWANRVLLGFGLAGLHYVVGFVSIAAFHDTRAINAIVLTFLFPLGLVATYINPHRMALAAVANSLFCGFVGAYVLSTWLNRRV